MSQNENIKEKSSFIGFRLFVFVLFFGSIALFQNCSQQDLMLPESEPIPLAVEEVTEASTELDCGIGTMVGDQCEFVFDQAGESTFEVPEGVDLITMRAWGAGGGGAGKFNNGSGDGETTSTGGAGAFVVSDISVAGGDVLTVTVGAGGLRGDPNEAKNSAGGGGGASGVQSESGDLVLAGAGGGGGSVNSGASGVAQGGAGGGETGQAGTSGDGEPATNAGQGGQAAAPGAGGNTGRNGGCGAGLAGADHDGGNVSVVNTATGGAGGAGLGNGGSSGDNGGDGPGGGGGAGHFGGGAGSCDASGSAGGGGSSSAVGENTVMEAGDRRTPGGVADPYFVDGVGLGGLGSDILTDGGAGKVVFVWMAVQL